MASKVWDRDIVGKDDFLGEAAFSFFDMMTLSGAFFVTFQNAESLHSFLRLSLHVSFFRDLLIVSVLFRQSP